MSRPLCSVFIAELSLSMAVGHRYFVALEKQLVEEFGEDLEISSTADPGTTGNFEVTLDGKVRDSAAQTALSVRGSGAPSSA